MNSELERLRFIGWVAPNLDDEGIFTVGAVNEDLISFPNACYVEEELNAGSEGFWAKERAKAIRQMLYEFDLKVIWEIGAGNGNASVPLRNAGVRVIPIEPLRSGALQLVKNNFQPFQATLQDLKLPGNSVAAFGAFDVLEHLEDPDVLLSEIFRVLKPGGAFLCSVPAYEWLYSDFDISIGHFRRYSKKSIERTLESAQFEIMQTSWLFGFLVLPAFLLRRIPFLLGRRRNFGALNRTNNPQSYFNGL